MKFYNNIKDFFQKLQYLLDNFQTIKRIIEKYDSDIKYLECRASSLEDFVKSHVDIAVDINDSRYGMNTVIVIGRYKKHDYVNCFQLQSEDIPHLVEQLKDMERYGKIRRVDSPIAFRGVIDRMIYDDPTRN